MGYKHTQVEILEGALAVAFDEGLSRLSFGRVAAHLGTSDRIVVYYFPSKDALIGAVLTALAGRLQATLAPTLTSPAADHLALVRIAWPTLAHRDADPVFALFFEALGLAASGREPYRTVVRTFVDGWIEWTSGCLTGATARRRAEAEATVAVLDGLLLLRQLAGPDAADRAARQFGVTTSDSRRRS